MKKLIATMLILTMAASLHAADFVDAEKLDKVFENYSKKQVPGWGLLTAQKPKVEIVGAKPKSELNKLTKEEKKSGFKLLFNGENLDGWKAAENPKSFSVEDGLLKIKGPRGHLFYEGPVNEAKFKDFHFKAQVVTFPKANSGIFFHTKFQPGGWPRQGYEAQVNSTHKDPRKTASVYATKDVHQSPSRDYKWFQYEIIVKGKTVTMKVDGKVVNEYTEPDGAKPPKHLSEGTIAIQAHDPGSVVHYRNIMLKVLQ